jgi:hypothetical protein
MIGGSGRPHAFLVSSSPPIMVGDVPQSSPHWTLRGGRPKCSKHSVPKVLFKTTNNENAVILFFSLHHGGDPPTVFTNRPDSSSKRIFPRTMVHSHILIVFRFQHVVTKRLPNIKNKESERRIGSSSTMGRFLLIWREGGAQEWRSTLLGFTCSRRGGLQKRRRGEPSTCSVLYQVPLHTHVEREVHCR